MDMTEILEYHLEQHNVLGKQKDALDKELFDSEHRAVWDECNQELTERLAELQEIEYPNEGVLAEICSIESYLGV